MASLALEFAAFRPTSYAYISPSEM